MCVCVCGGLQEKRKKTAISKPEELKSELEASKQSLTIYYMLGVCSAQIPLYHVGKLSGPAYIYANAYTAVSAVRGGRCQKVGQEKLHRGDLCWALRLEPNTWKLTWGCPKPCYVRQAAVERAWALTVDRSEPNGLLEPLLALRPWVRFVTSLSLFLLLTKKNRNLHLQGCCDKSMHSA